MILITKDGNAHALDKITSKTFHEIKRILYRVPACEHSISAYPMDLESAKGGFSHKIYGKLNGELQTIRSAPDM